VAESNLQLDHLRMPVDNLYALPSLTIALLIVEEDLFFPLSASPVSRAEAVLWDLAHYKS
jgi:hypothetical protein